MMRYTAELMSMDTGTCLSLPGESRPRTGELISLMGQTWRVVKWREAPHMTYFRDYVHPPAFFKAIKNIT